MNENMDEMNQEHTTVDIQNGQAAGELADQGSQERLFTQKDVNEIIEKRLSRERKKIQGTLAGLDPKEAEMETRQQMLEERERRLDAKILFREEGLPEEALELLNYEDKESCDKTIELVRTVFQANVNREVERRLCGGKPIKKAPEDNSQGNLRSAFGLNNHEE